MLDDAEFSDAVQDAIKESGELSFGAALAYLKQGKRVARRGWNGKGMWLLLVSTYGVSMELTYGASTPRPELRPWIGMKTADNSFVPWLASQTDILAEDWAVIG